jgi:hypothetical protein
MKNKIETQIDLWMWEVLKQIKKDRLLTPKENHVRYDIAIDNRPSTYPSLEDQRMIIKKLHYYGVIKVCSRHYGNPDSMFDVMTSPAKAMNGEKPTGFDIDIVEEKFNEMFSEYEMRHEIEKIDHPLTKPESFPLIGITKETSIKLKKKSAMTDSKIRQIEILKNTGRIKVYINKDYGRELDFSRGKSWSKMYELAENGSTAFNKSFYDYFNPGSKNPLYGRHGFESTEILKVEDGLIVKNIEKIDLITPKKRTQKLNSA